MPVQFLNKSERNRLNKFPKNISNNDIIKYFTLSDLDREQIPLKSNDFNRLGFALQLCTLRYLGFCPDAMKKFLIQNKNLRFQTVQYRHTLMPADKFKSDDTGSDNYTGTEKRIELFYILQQPSLSKK